MLSQCAILSLRAPSHPWPTSAPSDLPDRRNPKHRRERSKRRESGSKLGTGQSAKWASEPQVDPGVGDPTGATMSHRRFRGVSR